MVAGPHGLLGVSVAFSDVKLEAVTVLDLVLTLSPNMEGRHAKGTLMSWECAKTLKPAVLP